MLSECRKCWGQKVRVQDTLCTDFQQCIQQLAIQARKGLSKHSYHDVGQGGVSGFIQSQVCGDNSRQVDTHQFQAPVHLSRDVELGALSLQFRGEGRLKRREETLFSFGSQAHMPPSVVACSMQNNWGMGAWEGG